MNVNVMRLSIGIPCLLVSLSIAWIVTAGRAAESARSPKPSEQAITGELRQLLKARYDIAAGLLVAEEKRLERGNSTVTDVHQAACRVRDSALELMDEPAKQLAALTDCLAVARRLEDLVNHRVEKGTATMSDKELARYFRLDAEIALLRIKRQAARTN
jgi:hypothetical protein